MTTPELLAKREQRRRMEAQAAAISRPNLSRRLLQPVQDRLQQQQQPHQQQQPASSVSGLAPSPNMFSRAGVKRAAPPEAHVPKPPADTGVSAEELARVSFKVL